MKKALISSYIFENKSTGLKLKNILIIRVPIDLPINDSVISTELALDLVTFDFNDFEKISNLNFENGLNNQDNEASVYAEGVHFSAEITHLKFDTFKKNIIKCQIIGKVLIDDTEYNLELSGKLHFDILWIPPSMCEPILANFSKATELVSKCFNIDQLEQPQIVHNGFQNQIAFKKKN